MLKKNLFGLTAVIAAFMLLSFAACKTDDDSGDKKFKYPVRYQVVPGWTAQGENTIAVNVGGDSVDRAVGSTGYLPVIHAERNEECNNYIIYLGHINNVPIGDFNAMATYSGGSPTTITHASSVINSTTVGDSVSTAVRETTVTTKVNQKTASVNAGFSFSGFSIGANAKVENTITNSTMKELSIENTVSTAETKANSNTNTVSYTIGNNSEPIGRYRIMLFATTDVYLSVQLKTDDTLAADPEISVCARKSSYTYLLDYDPHMSGDFFGRTGGGGMLPDPNDFDFSSLPVPPSKPRFVAVGNSGKMAYSDDGINWEQITTGVNTRSWNGVAYGNKKFIAIGNNANVSNAHTNMASSNNGAEWNTLLVRQGTNNNTITNWNRVTYVNDRFIVAGTYGTNATSLWRFSTDGVVWTIPSGIPTASRDFAYGYDRWVAVGSSRIAHSLNFTSWTNVTSTETWNSVTYGNHNNGFVTVGNAGSMAYSHDGINWSVFTVGSLAWNRVYYNGALFVAAGSIDGSGHGKMAYSTTGTEGSWTEINAGASTWLDVTYGNGLWVAVGNAAGNIGRIATSSDGINWTEKNVGEVGASYWNGVTFGIY